VLLQFNLNGLLLGDACETVVIDDEATKIVIEKTAIFVLNIE